LHIDNIDTNANDAEISASNTLFIMFAWVDLVYRSKLKINNESMFACILSPYRTSYLPSSLSIAPCNSTTYHLVALTLKYHSASCSIWIQTPKMAEASLIFPAICLTVSFLFVVLFYNASIKDRLEAFHRSILLPTYRWIKRKTTTQNSETIVVSQPTYEIVNMDENIDELPDEPQASFERPWFFPRPNQSRETPAPDSPTSAPEEGGIHDITQPPGNVYFADSTARYRNEGGYHVINYSSYSESDDEADPDEFRVLTYTERADASAVPNVWEYELERPIFVADRHASVAWLEELVQWTAEGAFALVAPPMVMEIMDRR
jgi:hypothetical protein